MATGRNATRSNKISVFWEFKFSPLAAWRTTQRFPGNLLFVRALSPLSGILPRTVLTRQVATNQSAVLTSIVSRTAKPTPPIFGRLLDKRFRGLSPSSPTPPTSTSTPPCYLTSLSSPFEMTRVERDFYTFLMSLKVFRIPRWHRTSERNNKMPLSMKRCFKPQAHMTFTTIKFENTWYQPEKSTLGHFTTSVRLVFYFQGHWIPLHFIVNKRQFKRVLLVC